MSQWEIADFTDVVRDLSSGNVKIPQRDYLLDGPIPIVDQGRGLIGGYTDASTALCRAELPVVIFGDHTRVLKLVDFPFAIGADGVKVLKPCGALDERFFYHYLRYVDIPSAGYDRHFKYLKRLEVPIPPLTEQRRIAAILDHADALRTKRREALAHLDELTQSIFIDMFGDPASNSRDWPVRRLADVLARPLQNGAYFPKDDYSDDGIEMVHMGDVFYGIVERGKLRRVNCSTDEIEKYGLGAEDILIARRSLNHSGAAKPCLVPICDDPLLFESSLIRATPDPRKVTVGYLFSLLSNERFRGAHIHPIVTGATISGVSQTNLAALRVPVPPLVEQFRMKVTIEAVDRIRLRHAAALAELDTLFASLQSRAFRGEL